MSLADLLLFISLSTCAFSLVFGLLLLLYWYSGRSDATGLWWGIGVLALGPRSMMHLAAWNGSTSLAAAVFGLYMLPQILLLAGIYTYLGRSPPWRVLLGLFAAVGVAQAGTVMAGHGDVVARYTVPLVQAACYLWSAWLFLSVQRGRIDAPGLAMGILSLAFGVSWVIQSIYAPDPTNVLAYFVVRFLLALLWGTTLLVLLQVAQSRRLERALADARLHEAGMRASEQRLRSILDHMPVAVVVKTGDRYSFVNRAHADLTGIPAEDMATLGEAGFLRRMGWAADERRHVVEARRQVVASGATLTREVRRRMKNGQLRHLLVSTFRLGEVGRLGEAGSGEGETGVVITDVTEQRRLESNLAQMQKMESLGRLAGGIAHDFNNIVGAVSGFARFIVEDSVPGSNQADLAEKILSATGRARQLIQQIMTFSGRNTGARGPVDLAAAATDTASLLHATLPSTTRMVVEPATAPVMAHADASQVSQVLINLVINAHDALEKRPGEIRMRAYQGDPEQLRGLLPGEIATLPDGRLQRADGHIDADAAYVVVEVADTGVGMNQEVMQRIYEPFFTTKPTGQGTGLGLPVVHGIVQAHGGVIEIVSGPGAGAVFRIWLPQARAAGAPAPFAAAAAHDIAHDRGYVLVVDDDGHFGDMVAVTLERLGCEVAVIQHPTEALAAFESSADLWQLVICDRMMPDINGLDLIRRIKARRPDVPCILCTGLGKPDGQSEATAAGADAYLQKPIAAGVLEAVVKRLLGQPAPKA